MKKLKFYGYIILLAVFMTAMGCQQLEDELKEKPYSFYAAETFYQVEDQAFMAVMGVYEQLADFNTYGVMLNMFTDCDTDQQVVAGISLASDRRQICHYEASPTVGYVQSLWGSLWVGVNRANSVIEKIPEMALYENGTEEEKASLMRMLGEVKFLRALYYFDLIRIYGAVPLKLKATEAGDNNTLPRASYTELYDQMDKDLSEASSFVPWQSEIPTLNERVSKGAILGIQARVNLYRGGYYLDVFTKNRERVSNYKDYYQKALDLINQIVASEEHALNTSYEQIFKNQCELKIEPKEDMFQVGMYNPVPGAKDSRGRIGQYNGTGGQMRSVLAFWDSFEEGDPRRDIAIATFRERYDGKFTDYFVGGNFKKSANWSVGKWRQSWHSSQEEGVSTNINFVLLRYTDIVLMQAEIENELNEGPNAAAYEAINSIRERVGLDLYLEGMSKDDFFEAIVNERSKELCYEGFRKFDLMRWGILKEKLEWANDRSKEIYAKFPYVASTYYEDLKDELWPIPQVEIAENTEMIQNPNY